MRRRGKRYLIILVIARIAISASPLFAGGSGEADNEAPSATAQSALTFTVIPREQLPQEFLDQIAPGTAGDEFTTDFSRATVSFSDVISGGPSKDGIPAIDTPRFDTIREAQEWLQPQEAVLVYSHGDTTHVYPLQILMWHEIVNDTVDGRPIAISYCPLCNTGVGFDRRIDGTTLDFGTTGRLRYSNLIMYDRQTESWWQQASGDAIAGFLAGHRLTPVPLQIAPFGEVAAQWPEARVLNRNTGHNRSYGRNPYVGYDSSTRPFLFRGPEIDDEFRLLDRALVIEHGGEEAVIAYPTIREERLRLITLEAEQIYIIWYPGTASALSAETVADGQDVGSANAFLARTADGDRKSVV